MTLRKKIFNEKTLVYALGAGIIGGVVLGLVAQQTENEDLAGLVQSLQILGKLFLSSLKMVVVPIVLFSVTSGVANLGGGKEVGRKVAKTMVYFFSTSFLAVFIGILFTNLIAPVWARVQRDFVTSFRLISLSVLRINKLL